MDHLKLFIKGAIEFQKENFNCSDMTEGEIFECVMENVESMIEHYRYSDFIKDDNSDGK
jgi:hypothetical protein